MSSGSSWTLAVYKLLFGLIVLALASCGQNHETAATAPQYSADSPDKLGEYVFAIHPLHNPARLFEVYAPLVDYLDRHIPQARFRLEASRNYHEFEKKLYAREPDFALPNPYQTLNALRYGYRVIAKMGDDEKFTGILLVRRDSNIRQPSDLKGKKISYPAPTALAATMLPQYFLQTHGLDVEHDVENIYVGSQESSIMGVYLGNVAAGATWPLPWLEFQQEHPDQAGELEVKWETEHLINNGVVARDDVPEALARQVADLLANFHATDEGRAILQRMQLSRFELAKDQDYMVIADFLRRFSEKVRPLNEELP
ncbi:MAG: phosphate/phosphite/phosphonate ABC transporter substrate-binding protein [Pseudomonadota bacterium]